MEEKQIDKPVRVAFTGIRLSDLLAVQDLRLPAPAEEPAREPDNDDFIEVQ